MTTMTLVFVCLVGLYSVCGAVFNWDWFLNRRGNSLLTNLLGRTGARIAFAVLGLAVIIAGVYTYITQNG